MLLDSFKWIYCLWDDWLKTLEEEESERQTNDLDYFLKGIPNKVT